MTDPWDWYIYLPFTIKNQRKDAIHGSYGGRSSMNKIASENTKKCHKLTRTSWVSLVAEFVFQDKIPG